MCRSLTDGGRRCPCSSPVVRSAKRRGAHAARQAAHAAIGAGGSLPLEPAAVQTRWQDKVVEIRELAGTVAIFHLSAQEAGLDADTHSDAYVAAQRWLTEAGFGQTLQEMQYRVAVHTGELVAAEAESRAGVTADEVRSGFQARQQAAQLEYDSLQASHVDAMREQFTDRLNELQDAAERKAVQLRQARAAGTSEEELRRGPDWQERVDLLDQATKLHEDYVAALNDYRARTDNLRKLAAGSLDDTAREQLTALSNAYVDVLSEVRDFGGDFSWHPKATKKARDAFGEVARLYPSDWIAASNRSTVGLLPKVVKARAHYSHGHVEMKKERRRAGRVYIYDSHDRIPADTVWETNQVLPPEPGDLDFEVRVRKELWDVRRPIGPFDESTPPRGRGWEVWTSPDDPDRKLWRRPQFRMETISGEAVAEVTTNENSQRQTVTHLSSTAAVCAHELGHRMEYTVAAVTAVEHAFLEERCGDEQPVALYGGRRHRGQQEIARPDKFVDAYIGKVYPARGNTRPTEVLSMGVESLLTGTHGGLVGAGAYDQDLHMRATILGMFATVGARKVRVRTPAHGATAQPEADNAASKGVHVSAAHR